MLEFNDLCFSLGKEKPILRHVDVNIQAGDFCLIIGPNGAGKTTMLKIMSGLIHDYTGKATMGGREIKEIPFKEMARDLSYQPQFDEFSLPIRCKEILMAGRYPYKAFFKSYSDDDYSAFDTVVRQLELESFLDRDINTLSGGERKKVMLASAFIQDVSTILFDEPFTFLDPEAISNLKRMMLNLHAMGKTLIVVSHNFETLFPIVNKIIALRDGEILYAGDKTFDKTVLMNTYNTRFEKIIHNGKEIIFPDD